MQPCHQEEHDAETNKSCVRSERPSINHPGFRRRRVNARASKNANPLQTGIIEFLKEHVSPSSLAEHGLVDIDIDTLSKSLPKRYTVYPPLLLLPANAFTVPPAWGALYAALDSDPQQQQQQREALYACLLRSFSRYGVTHIAINAPIAPTDSHGRENRSRSPSGLIPLYGDFGPLPTSTTITSTTTTSSGSSSRGSGSATTSAGTDGEEGLLTPDSQALERALWVRTVQNQGIVQVWAPMYTMFSRGNVTEKARILGSEGTFEGLDQDSLEGDSVADISVVDMYAGIGYFVFSYLKRGVKRVWGFEINGWSIEGLRRGCEENGWGCKIVRVRKDGTLEGDSTVVGLVAELSDSDRVVVFHGDNSFAADILLQIRSAMESRNMWSEIRHVNLGLLPSSRPAWENACRMLDPVKGGWLHVHENVDIHEISGKSVQFTAQLKSIASQVLGPSVSAECRHVELVKTYAPGVMHCVFDIALTP